MEGSGGVRVAAVLAAGGEGRRMGGPTKKQFRPLGGRSVLARALEAFDGQPGVDGLVVALPREELEPFRRRLAGGPARARPLVAVVGGATRQESVLRGLEAAAAWSPRLVLVHDGVRPLVSHRLIAEVIEGAERWGAVVPVLPVSETVKRVAGDGRVEETLDRRPLRLVQTPEGFRFPLVLEAARRAQAEGFLGTDTSSLVERSGHPVRTVPGERWNLKLTGPEDLEVAEALLGRSGGAELPWRVGTGYDAHRLVGGRPLVLGGLEIPHERGLEGHSDADVLLHALADALLGAAGLGDLGQHFPDSDPAWAGASSLLILSRTAQLLRRAGWEPSSADTVVIAQRPRLAPHVPEMRRRIARALGVTPEAVSVKATTTEGLGFEGREEGISATAVALVRRAGGLPAAGELEEG